MTPMMVPATLPLILLYHTIARSQLSPARSQTGTTALLTGYPGVWAAADTPVHGYSLLTAAGSLAAALPALFLVTDGIYQFTPLRQICHARCSSPLFFLLHNWRQETAGALHLGAVHGLDYQSAARDGQAASRLGLRGRTCGTLVPGGVPGTGVWCRHDLAVDRGAIPALAHVDAAVLGQARWPVAPCGARRAGRAGTPRSRIGAADPAAGGAGPG